jgi:phenylacetate-CoA ligase
MICKHMPRTRDQLYAQVYRHVLWPAYEQRLRSRPTLRYLAQLQRAQWASRDALEAMQLAQLRKLLAHAWRHVPLYRARLGACGLGPDGVRHLDDLRRLPLLGRDEAQQNPQARESVAPPLPVIQKATSGSTGRPLSFGYDLDSEYWRNAVKLRAYGWAGYRPGDLVLFFWGMLLPSHTPRLHRAKMAADRALRREIYVDCGQRGDDQLRKVVDAIRRKRPAVLICYTQAAADLARFVVREGLRDWPDIPVICGAERLFPGDRDVIAQAFGPAVFETYGSREVMLIAAESEAHDGLLVQMENLVVEVVVRDGQGGERPARPGEVGEVVLTDLHNFGMPFIRYANGDLAIAGPDGPSACGRAHQRLAAIEGRVTETLVDARGGRVSGLTFNVMFAAIGQSVKQFQVVQHRDRSVTMRVVPAMTWGEGASRLLQDTAQKYLPGLPFRIETVPVIPTSASGKRQVVVVER